MARPTGLDRSPRRGRLGRRGGQARPGGDLARSRHRDRVEAAAERRVAPLGLTAQGGMNPGTAGRCTTWSVICDPTGCWRSEPWPGPRPSTWRWDSRRRLVGARHHPTADRGHPRRESPPARGVASARAGPVTTAGDGTSGAGWHGGVQGGPLPRPAGTARRAVRALSCSTATIGSRRSSPRFPPRFADSGRVGCCCCTTTSPSFVPSGPTAR